MPQRVISIWRNRQFPACQANQKTTLRGGFLVFSQKIIPLSNAKYGTRREWPIPAAERWETSAPSAAASVKAACACFSWEKPISARCSPPSEPRRPAGSAKRAESFSCKECGTLRKCAAFLFSFSRSRCLQGSPLSRLRLHQLSVNRTW